MLFAMGQIKGLTPPQIHALTICCLSDVFKYSHAQAVAFSENLISSASSKEENTSKTIFIAVLTAIINGRTARMSS